MNAQQLRELQAPLKVRYKEEPSSAVHTLRAKARVSQGEITCVLESGKPGTPAGLHPATGGDGSAACSGEMLLEALVSCAGVTLASVATAMGIALGDSTVSAEGDLDFRGTLGVAKDVAVGFTEIRLIFGIASDAPADSLKKLVELTERYCVVFQTIARPPVVRFEIAPGAA
jgi:uncharacterized OsmC-like protein